MNTHPMLPISWVAASLATGIIAIAYPLALAIIVNRRLRVSWKYFFYGVAIFFIFQVITRIPLVSILGPILAPSLRGNVGAQYIYIAALALTAGLFEEAGRYVGYRWLMGKEEKTWDKAAMYGIGHGGLESILLVGIPVLANTAILLALVIAGLDKLPAQAGVTIAHQVAAIQAQPWWVGPLGGWERLWTIPVQIMLSVIVLQVFRRNSLAWLWVAIGLHFLIDFTTAAFLQTFGRTAGSLLGVEGLIALYGLIAIIVIFRLRDPLPAGPAAAIMLTTHPER